jgi:cell division protein FtsI/penicillin-binding protein 2
MSLRTRIVKFLAVVLLLCFSCSVSAFSSDFFSRVSREVDRALKRREGVVIWFDRRTGERMVWGDPDLAKQKFRPGSIFKIFLAEEALSQGLKPVYRCAGHDVLGGSRHTCWTRKGHGALDLPLALAQSCNLFFSSLGLQLGSKGLGHLLARHPEFDAVALNDFSQDELMALAIGDSPRLKISPEAMAGFWERFLLRLEEPDYAAIKEGLLRAVEAGTASRASVSGLTALGKTGTSDSEGASYKTDAWFLGAYPAADPRYGFVIFLKEAYGFREPSELARKIFAIAKETQ